VISHLVEKTGIEKSCYTVPLRHLSRSPEKNININLTYYQCCGSASAYAWICMVLVSWIRIRNPHSKCGFRTRGCGSGLSSVKIRAEVLVIKTIINIMHSKNSRSIKLPTERRILLLNHPGNYVCYGGNYT
jgi:hypothetical protein